MPDIEQPAAQPLLDAEQDAQNEQHQHQAVEGQVEQQIEQEQELDESLDEDEIDTLLADAHDELKMQEDEFKRVEQSFLLSCP